MAGGAEGVHEKNLRNRISEMQQLYVVVKGKEK